MHAIAMRKFISRRLNNNENRELGMVFRHSMPMKYDDRTVGRMGVKMGTEFKTINQRKCKLHQISLQQKHELGSEIIACSACHSTKP